MKTNGSSQANASRTDSIVGEHKDKSLDELVQLKIINPDQRAQRLKKPQLEADREQFEDQLAQYKGIHDDALEGRVWRRRRCEVDLDALEALPDLFEESFDRIVQRSYCSRGLRMSMRCGATMTRR